MCESGGSATRSTKPKRDSPNSLNAQSSSVHRTSPSASNSSSGSPVARLNNLSLGTEHDAHNASHRSHGTIKESNNSKVSHGTSTSSHASIKSIANIDDQRAVKRARPTGVPFVDPAGQWKTSSSRRYLDNSSSGYTDITSDSETHGRSSSSTNYTSSSSQNARARHASKQPTQSAQPVQIALTSPTTRPDDPYFRHPPSEYPPRAYDGDNRLMPPQRPAGKIPGSALEYLPILESRVDRLEQAIDGYAQHRAREALRRSVIDGLPGQALKRPPGAEDSIRRSRGTKEEPE